MGLFTRLMARRRLERSLKPSEAARVLGRVAGERSKAQAAIRDQQARAKIRAKCNEMRAQMNQPPIDWSAL